MCYFIERTQKCTKLFLIITKIVKMKEFIHKNKEICENIWKLQKYFIFSHCPHAEVACRM